MLCIQEELGNLSVKDKEPIKDNAVGNNKLESDVLKPSGWFDGLLGCLRPMLGIMGKGNGHDLKSYQGNKKNDHYSNSNISYGKLKYLDP